MIEHGPTARHQLQSNAKVFEVQWPYPPPAPGALLDLPTRVRRFGLGDHAIGEQAADSRRVQAETLGQDARRVLAQPRRRAAYRRRAAAELDERRREADRT